MKLRALATILIVGLFLANASQAAAQTPLAFFTVADGSGNPSDQGINVPVSLSSQGDAQVSIVEFDFNFDFDRLSVASVSVGSAASNAGKIFSYSQPSDGVVKVVIWDLDQDPEVIAYGPLANVSFAVRSGASPGASGLTLTNVIAGDLAAQEIDHSVDNGTFTVIVPTSTPAPTSTNSPLSTPSPTTSITPTPSNTPTTGPSMTPSNTSTPTATSTPGPSPTASSTSSGTLTPSATASSTPVGGATNTLMPTSEGAGEGLVLEGVAAATGTALAEFEAAVAATSTALAEEAAARPTDEIISTGPTSGTPIRPELFIAAGLLLLAITLGGGAAYLAWRQQQTET